MEPSNRIFLWMFVIASLLGAGLLCGLLIGPPLTDPWLVQLYFAAGALGALVYLFVIAIAAYIWGPHATDKESESRGKAVFDAITKIVPPIATLILGYYFGLQKAPSTDPPPDPPRAEAQTGEKG